MSAFVFHRKPTEISLPIPTSSHRRSAENACVETQLPQTRLLVPSNMLKLGSFITKPLGLLVGAKANDLLDTHDDDLLNQSKVKNKLLFVVRDEEKGKKEWVKSGAGIPG